MFPAVAKSKQGQWLSSLRGLLLWWIVGSGAILILVYVGILGYYFRYGASLKMKADFERHAVTYAESYADNPNAILPSGRGLNSYRDISDIPPELLDIFPEQSHGHRKIQILEVNDPDDLDDYITYFFDVINLTNAISSRQYKSRCEGRQCELIFFYSYQLGDSEWLYMTQFFFETEEITRDREFLENIILYFSLMILLLFTALAVLLIKRIGMPVKRLASWADNLTLSNFEENIPDFKYRELNLVAERLNVAFERISSSLEKEHRFLQHASHELRTPIAVALGNLEILEKLGDAESRSSNEGEAFDRLKYSVQEMGQLTETLLWLNRDSESMPPIDLVDIKGMIESLIENNEYLLEGKKVSVEVKGSAVSIHTPLVLCRIALANLIRNAFQYTFDGEVVIALSESSLTISNTNSEALSGEESEADNNYGFGLGLLLVERISLRLGWLYQYESRDNGRSSTIIFQ